MNTAIHQNSLFAFDYSVKPTLTKRQEQVYEVIKNNPGITLREIAEKLSSFSHVLSGRIGELKSKSKIKESGVKYFEGSKQPHTKWEAQ
jgi:predicted transcriptional regulator